MDICAILNAQSFWSGTALREFTVANAEPRLECGICHDPSSSRAACHSGGQRSVSGRSAWRSIGSGKSEIECSFRSRPRFHIRPPCRSMAFLQNASPSPVAGYSFPCSRPCPYRLLHTFYSSRPARNYPRFWIWRSSSERQRDLNPPVQRAAQRTI